MYVIILVEFRWKLRRRIPDRCGAYSLLHPVKIRNDRILTDTVNIVLALSIFPASHPASIVDADELNFCVRDGNRWTLTAINTNYVDGSYPSFICQSAPRSNSLWIIAPFLLFVNSCFVSLTKSKPSEAGLIWKRRATIQAEYHARVIWSIVSCARSW